MAKKNIVKRSLLKDTKGVTTVEYIIILALVAIVGIAVWKAFGNTIKTEVGAADGAVGRLPSGADDCIGPDC